MKQWKYIDVPDEFLKVHLDEGEIYFISSVCKWNNRDKSNIDELIQLRFQMDNVRKPEIKFLSLNYEDLLNDQRIIDILDDVESRFEDEFKKMREKQNK